MLELLTTKTSISGDGLPIKDITGNFSGLDNYFDSLTEVYKFYFKPLFIYRYKFYDINLDGLVKFHSGFIMSIDKAEISKAKYLDITNQTDAYVENIMTLKDINMTYEVDSELDEYKGKTYSMIIWIKAIEFKYSVSRNHVTGKVTSLIKFTNVLDYPKDFIVINFPSNPYT